MSECTRHPGKTVENGLGDYLCLKCEDLKTTDRCPRCHHDGKKDQIRWSKEGPDANGIWGSIDCTHCGKDRTSDEGVWHYGRYRWLVDARESFGDQFRWHAKDVAWRITTSREIPYALGCRISHWIYERFLTERRPGHATVIGRVHRDAGPK
jgi:hypothetical protein